MRAADDRSAAGFAAEDRGSAAGAPSGPTAVTSPSLAADHSSGVEGRLQAAAELLHVGQAGLGLEAASLQHQRQHRRRKPAAAQRVADDLVGEPAHPVALHAVGLVEHQPSGQGVDA